MGVSEVTDVTKVTDVADFAPAFCESLGLVLTGLRRI
jgi:hypothetical protein